MKRCLRMRERKSGITKRVPMPQKIIELEEKVRKLENEISRLKSNQDKDSHNSSLPPSADRKPKAANAYNGRTKTGKKSGGQPGHKGTTRRMEQMKQALACIGVGRA
jgi:transposase